MTYREALRKLEERQETRIELGLSRVRRHLKRLGDPHLGLRVIHVAGTNGKGSVCALLASILRAAGYKTGVYTSPHLNDVRERFAIGGRLIPKPAFARYFNRALKADREKKLTYFELLTSVAFQWFAESKVDAAVLETGLGGRLDATNVVERSLASVITSIDFDHMRFLGHTLPKIAAEKAGIIKRGCPVFCPSLAAPAMRAVKARAKALHAPLMVVRRPWRAVSSDWAFNRQTMADAKGRRCVVGLLGGRQTWNVALVRAVLDGLAGLLSVDERAWRRGLKRAALDGRFRVRCVGAKRIVLDGGHNPEAAKNLAQTWTQSPFSRRPARWIIGVMKDKDVPGILRPLAPHLRDVVTVRPPSPRAMDSVSLARLVRRAAPKARVAVERDPETAIKTWLGSKGPKTAVVCGSFYLVGGVMESLHG